MPIPSIWWIDTRRKGSWICLQTQKSLHRMVAQGQLFRVLLLCAGQSGHVAGDGPEGVQQGCLHSGFEEQQVHVNLL